MLEPQEGTGRTPASGFEFNRPVVISILYLVGLINGLTTVIGVILAYVWRGEPAEEWERGHYIYLIRTFWFGLLGGVIAAVLTLVLIGFLSLGIVGLWMLARSVNSLVRAGARQPIPDPDTLLL